jgi:endonuclease YncB( thermonuclease family)
MIRVQRFGFAAYGILILAVLIPTTVADAHRSGCHRWHSCESDRGTYTCGDLGYCSGCLDNPYCENGQVRRATQKKTPMAPETQPAERFSGNVVGVADGDTISVMRDGKAVTVRLQGIDCPEKRQAYGARAKQFTSQRVFGQVVTVIVRGTDRYGRTLGEVVQPDGMNLNRTLVEEGLAWWYRQYSDDDALRQLEEEARAAQRGLWADRKPVPPWEFRKAAKGVR